MIDYLMTQSFIFRENQSIQLAFKYAVKQDESYGKELLYMYFCEGFGEEMALDILKGDE